jgi:AraC family transcriptional regulator
MEQLIQFTNRNRVYSNCTRFIRRKQVAATLSIHFVFSGNETFQIGHKRLNVHPDSFLVIKENTSYTQIIDSDLPVDVFSMYFDARFIDEFEAASGLTTNKISKHLGVFNETLYPLTGNLKYTINHLKEKVHHGVKDEALLNHYLYHILISYQQLYNQQIRYTERLHFVKQITRAEVYHRVTMAREYLFSNYSENVSIKQLAEYCSLSVNHLHMAFKEVYQFTPHQYLTSIRLRRAKILLRQSQYAINEIAGIVGFESTSSFIRLFKKYGQITPQAYRCSGIA